MGLGLGLGIFLYPPGGGASLQEQTGRSEPRAGERAPDFELQSTAGRAYSLKEQAGSVVLLNFWATWCGPCRLEMPAIQERYERLQQDGLTVLAVNFDEPEQVVSAFGEELGLEFPLLLDPGGEVQRLYQIRGYPTSVFVDRDGIIRRVHIGIMTEGQLDEALRELGLETG